MFDVRPRILVTSAGCNAAITCLRALREQTELLLDLVAVDADPYAPGFLFANEKRVVPFAHETDYITVLLDICRQLGIRALVPTHSSEIPIILSNIELFENLSVRLCLPPLESAKIFANKWLAFQFFEKHGIPTPPTVMLNSDFQGEFPIFAKPLTGSGSRNCKIIGNRNALNNLIGSKQMDYIIQPVIEGPEYTVDVLADRQFEIVAAVPRLSLMKRNGLTVRARTVDFPEIRPIIRKIILEARLVGPLNIQFFDTCDGVLVTDVNLRLSAGGLPLSIAAGVNFPLLVVKMVLDMSFEKSVSYRENMTMVRYYDSVFFPGDK